MSNPSTSLLPSLSKSLPLWALVLLGIAGPIATVINFPQWTLQHPWHALGLFTLYEVGIFFAGIILKDRQHLESGRSKSTALLLETWLSGHSLGKRNRYFQSLGHKHRKVNFKGHFSPGRHTTLELVQVFVDLGITPSLSHQNSTKLLRALPEALRSGRHSIWDYINAQKNNKPQNLAIIGAPGSGKTTLLKYLTLSLTSDKYWPSHVARGRKLPVLLDLREQSESIRQDANLSLIQAIQDNLLKLNVPTSSAWWQRQLNKGRCLVMLDGLNEVANPRVRKDIVQWVATQMAAHGNNLFVITSRPHGYWENPLPDTTVLEVQPFNHFQVSQFIDSWYRANAIKAQQSNDSRVHTNARESTKHLLQQLQTAPALYELSTNPLLLTMMATVHCYHLALPESRVDLCAAMCELLLGKYQQAREPDQALTPHQKQQVLEPLAYHMMRHEAREAHATTACNSITDTLQRVSPTTSADVFLQQTGTTSGLLLERANGIYSFAHLALQEYLAARHIQLTQLEYVLVDRVGDSWWHETILLYAAQADASSIVSACLDDRAGFNSLVCAMEYLEEAREIQPQIHRQFEAMAIRAVEDPDQARCRLVVEALLARRLKRLKPIDENRSVDSTLITCAEYQLFLDEQRAIGTYRQPEHWSDYKYPPGQGTTPVIGVRADDAVAFCDWLTVRDSGSWLYRLPSASELHNHPLSTPPEVTLAGGYWIAENDGEYTIAETPASVAQTTLNILSRILDRDLNRNFDRVLDNDRVLARELAHTLDLDLDLARNRDLDRALSRDHALTHNRDANQARALANNLSHALDRALERALERTLNRNRGLDLARALDRAVTLANNLAYDLDRARVLTLDLALASNLNLASDRAHTLVRARDLARALARVLGLISQRNHDSMMASVQKAGITTTYKTVINFLCQYAAIVATLIRDDLTAYYVFVKSLSLPQKVSQYTVSQELNKWLEQQIENWADLYLALRLLETRRHGLTSAFEGIRIVREYQIEKA